MIYDNKDQKYTFADGYSFYANKGIVGISPDLDITEGYDGGITAIMTCDHCKNDAYREGLNKGECIELADYMIAKWQEYKGRLQ